MKKKILLSILILPMVFPAIIFGQTWEESRNHEALVFTGNSMSKFETTPIGHIFVLAYHEKDNSWHELTLQIDELDDQGYFGTNYNNIVDLNDEFAIMVCEAGDYAPSSSWIDDENSRQYGRLQFELINPDDPINKKYVYVYRSSTFAHNPDLPNYYIKYVAASSGASDTVKAQTYLEGHNEKGLPDVWKIADSTGSYGIDILDRQKARVKGKYLSLLSYDMDEDNLKAVTYEYKRGPIRIIRYIKYTASIFGNELSVGTFKYFYYPDRIVALGADKTLSSDYGVSLIRQSFDLKKSAIGMVFHNPNYFNVPIDGIQDTVITNIQPSPVMNWYMCSGSPGTFVMLNEVTPPSSKTNELYYQESLNGGTADKTSDTGDDSSFCDVGIMFKGDKMKGQVSIPYFTYFLPGNRNRDVGATLAYQTQNPVYQDVKYNLYDPPAELMVMLPDTSGASQYPIAIPVKIGNTTGLDIKSCRLVIRFDSKVLTAKNISIANTLAENWDVPGFSIATDTITIEMQGTDALEGSGVLVYLNFDVTGTTNQQSLLHFVQAKLNVWNPLAVTDDGIFTTLPIPQVMVSLPDTSGAINTKISIPILVDDVTSLNITSCQLELSYSRVILDATSISLQGTLASDWSTVKLVDNPGYLTLEIAGIAPLQGKGALVWINFDVIGSPGQSTTILFKKMRLNDGIPIANTRNGRFAVNATTIDQITVLIPDTTVQSGVSLDSPVLISKLINAEINDYKMTLEFDSTILAFKNIDLTGTLTSPWRLPNVVSSPGKIQISAEGDLPLSGLGTLIFIVFDVIGPDGSNTIIHFSEMIVNSGALSTITDDGIINVQGVVPVELASFIAISDGRNVTLRWHTVTETNNFGFYLQRKSNLSPDWQTIKFLPGAGTTIIPQSYSIIDWQLNSGTWFYRLKQQDLDGQVHYSQIIEVNLLPTQFILYQNYPNPFNSSTIIRYDLAAGEHDVKIIIFDLLGQQIKILFNEQQQGGSYQISWDGSDDSGRSVATGIYYCHLLVGQTTFVKKMALIE